MLGKLRITLAEGTGLRTHFIELRLYLVDNLCPGHGKTRSQKQILCITS
jgi:hypothetical protein